MAMKHQSKRNFLILGSTFSMLLLFIMASFVCRWYPRRKSQDPNKILTEIYQKGMYAADRPILSFSQRVFDFGTVTTGGEAIEHKYLFTNTGKKPLMIRQVLGGCCDDCVTAAWPTQPVQPGKQAEIKVKLKNTDQVGAQDYVIVVSANTDPPATRLLFKGVLDAPNKK
jgi:Protein of unknown function (DUF1573)